MIYIFVGLGGMVGVLLRYGLSAAFNPAELTTIPWGTLLVNWAGCFVLGVLSAWKGLVDRTLLRAFLTTGLIGAFTTFSALSAELMMLLRHGRFIEAISYAGLSLAGGYSFVWCGRKAHSSIRGA